MKVKLHCIFSFPLSSLLCQVLTLVKKISTKWGDFNATDADDSDTPNWGFLNMKKLGRIVLGIAKEELRDLPIRGIEDVIDVLGREKDWDRGQVRGSHFCGSQSPIFHLSCVHQLFTSVFYPNFQDCNGINSAA